MLRSISNISAGSKGETKLGDDIIFPCISRLKESIATVNKDGLYRHGL